jgi:hypothetical protein
MVLSAGAVKALADAIARKILDEGMWHCKTMPGRGMNEGYASQSRVNAMAAGNAWTNRILWLTVTAP